MKKVVKYIFLGSLLFTFACTDSSTEATNDNGLVGLWKWNQTTGGIVGSTTYPTDNNKYLLQITIDNHFIESRNGTITFFDSFDTYVDKTYNAQVIDFVNSKRFSYVVTKVTSDSLILWDGFIDGYFSFYTRVR